MILCYVAGPFTDPSAEGILDNIRNATALGHQVRLLGAGAAVPHLAGAPYVESGCVASHPDVFGYEWWIAETKELLRRCDAMILTPDWERSNGAKGEHAEAVRLGMPIFYALDELEAWMKGLAA